MRVIHKYPLGSPWGNQHTTIEMPLGTKVLYLQIQRDIPCIWVDKPTEIEGIPNKAYHFRTFGTGMEFTPLEGEIYLGTYQEGPFVWHVYYTIEELN